MVYLSIETNKIKVLFFKKNLLGQYEIGFFDKKHEATLLDQGQVKNIDLLASAIKESLTQTNTINIKDKEVCLILPQEAFQFLRIIIPKDIADTALNSFIKDKVRVALSKGIENFCYDYITKENNDHREVIFYGIERDILKKYQDVLTLLDLKLNSILPSPLAYFKLFEKTLRREKHEKIFYVHYNKTIQGYFYDSLGPLNNNSWIKESVEPEELEEELKQKVQKLEAEGIKLNRIILAGNESENIRQDTFTKKVGVWTNLLKRIIPNFYQDYLKLFIGQKNQPLPFLELDECFGAFIFLQENKNFSLLKENPFVTKMSFPKFKLPLKEISIFVISFILSFVALYFVSNQKNLINFKFASIKKSPTPTSIPTLVPPTPTPTLAKEKLKIKVLNGSGTPGKAASVVEILKNKGYQETISGGNADNFDYEVTEIKLKKEFSLYANVIQTDLKDYDPSIQITELDDKETADAIIIIGQNFK